MRIVPIVEGHGDAQAVRVLLPRIVAEMPGAPYLEVLHPIRVRRQKILKEGELERTLDLAARQTARGDGILIMLDADSDCPYELSRRLLARAATARADRRVRAVFPKPMYEAWFLAAAPSIAGHRELDVGLIAPADPESNPNPKAWLTERMPPGRSYRETLDQAAFTATFDLRAACAAPSFRKLCRDIASLF